MKRCKDQKALLPMVENPVLHHAFHILVQCWALCTLHTRGNPSAQKRSWPLCLIKKQIMNTRNAVHYGSTDATQHTTLMLHILDIWNYITSTWLVFLIRFVVLHNYYGNIGKYLKLDETVSFLILSSSLFTNHNKTDSIINVLCNYIIRRYMLNIWSEHNYIFTQNNTMGVQLHLSALYIGRRQVVTRNYTIYAICGEREYPTHILYSCWLSYSTTWRRPIYMAETCSCISNVLFCVKIWLCSDCIVNTYFLIL
jgi:hypothetical protein